LKQIITTISRDYDDKTVNRAVGINKYKLSDLPDGLGRLLASNPSKKLVQFTGNIMKSFKYLGLLFFLIFNLTACVSKSENESQGIYYQWTLEKIIYDDESINRLEQGNFVQIHQDYILEIIKGHGNRRYAFSREQDVLTLISDNNHVIWEIIKQDRKELQIQTPIGLYVLTR